MSLNDLRDLFDVPGAGMDKKLHKHAVKMARNAVKEGRGPIRAYGAAAGAWCPGCESPDIDDNGHDEASESLAYCCASCGHQWTPHEA